MTPELGVEPRGRADERDAEIEMARGRQRAVDDVPRGVVAAHRVDAIQIIASQVRVQSSGFQVQGSFGVRGSWFGFGFRVRNPEPERTLNPEP